ncbi:ChrR family anti-sigma-E factor [Roseibacterium beibuensis]|uniref:Anti-sigma-E factor ChrR n=1 Tax=[Roseibacterium] beibuensis TaxID=1193142 RepID=A0ABP9LPA9_9RHOB|nr:ChrR family anti-sigma-E factor [Roseibacterium beibuensis]MCS6626151.1 ChrR family anti-sigma-E factor [Roseibacterium beibuensis]
MTDVQHQIPDDLLMGYATGALPQAFDLVIATHVSMSDDVRSRLAGFEALGGAVLEDLEEAEIAPDSLEQTLARIGEDTDRTVTAQPKAGVFPGPLRALLGGDTDSVKWRSVGLGARQAVLHADKEGTARLLYIPAGQAMPEHSHGGMELTLVLQGGYSADDGHFVRGDLEVADNDTHHTPIADDDGEDCICLVATDARLKFQKLLPRIAQPFIGI